MTDDDGRIRHEFTADGPNQLRLTDITEHKTAWIPAVVATPAARSRDASEEVYGTAEVGVPGVDRSGRFGFRAAALAVGGQPDRGPQLRSRKFLRALTRHPLVGSMGRVTAAGDNAAMKSFFALLQKNILNRRPWTTREQLRIAIVTWIERIYHRRRQAALGRLTTVQFEVIMNTPPALAA